MLYFYFWTNGRVAPVTNFHILIYCLLYNYHVNVVFVFVSYGELHSTWAAVMLVIKEMRLNIIIPYYQIILYCLSGLCVHVSIAISNGPLHTVHTFVDIVVVSLSNWISAEWSMFMDGWKLNKLSYSAHQILPFFFYCGCCMYYSTLENTMQSETFVFFCVCGKNRVRLCIWTSVVFYNC